jgi:hypothetical protein
MSIGDLVIVDGGFIFGKLMMAQQERVETVFNRKQMEYPPGFFAKTAVVEEQGVDDIVEWDRSGATATATATASESDEEEDDVITMGTPATSASAPAKAQAAKAPAKANEWTGRRGGKREDTGELDIDDI